MRLSLVFHCLALVTGLSVAAVPVAAEPAGRDTSACGAAPEQCETLNTARQRFRRPDATPYPADKPYSEAMAALGRQLFFDPRLSRGNDISCASCHDPERGWEDGESTAIGSGGRVNRRHTPTLENLAWSPALLWDGRTPTLESQVWFPLTAHNEMAQDVRELTKELAAVPVYAEAFAELFPERGISLITVSEAIARFERGIVSGEAPFDRWVAGDEDAITGQAKRGFTLFVGKANCEGCHSGWNFTDGQFHDIGLPHTDDDGRFIFTRDESDRHAFKTPGLRNLSRRAPYMHNGSVATLREVLAHFNGGFVKRPSLSVKMAQIELNEAEINDLLAFLRTLDSDPPP